MKYVGKKVEDIKIAYIGGGSRGWAWGLMSDLAEADDISGQVALYDIDFEAAKNNEIIGNMYKDVEGANSVWEYTATKTIDEALNGANFVVISIQPATYDEMASDVHTPEKYNIWQPVGDTVGPGGIVRSMRCLPMIEYIGEKIKENCPDAWVINYTNPMSLCVKTLYRVFPKIKAFGCCHEVFGTQTLLTHVVKEMLGVENVERDEIKVNPVAVNHFTWLTSATYKNIDLFPYYKKFCDKYAKIGFSPADGPVDKNWMNSVFGNDEMVKMDLFQRFGYIAAAGDRHLAEFCEGKWYLESPERVKEMHFQLTTVDFRRKMMQDKIDKSQRIVKGEEKLTLRQTGEEGVHQIRSLLGLCELITNVNIPNQGQIPNLPLGAIVETNAIFRANELKPVFAGPIPQSIYTLVTRVCGSQEALDKAIANRDVEAIFNVFINDPLVTCSVEDARKLFKEMVENTKAYLTDYDLSCLD